MEIDHTHPQQQNSQLLKLSPKSTKPNSMKLHRKLPRVTSSKMQNSVLIEQQQQNGRLSGSLKKTSLKLPSQIQFISLKAS